MYFHGVNSTIQKCQSWQGRGCIQAGDVLFQNQFLTGVALKFKWGKVLFKSGVAFSRIRYVDCVFGHVLIFFEALTLTSDSFAGCLATKIPAQYIV